LQTQRRDELGELLKDMPPETLVAALKHSDPIADAGEYCRKRCRALPPPPAVHEKLRLRLKRGGVGVQKIGDVSCHERSTGAPRSKGAFLTVKGANACPLRIVEHWPIHSARQMVLGELARGPRIEHPGVTPGPHRDEWSTVRKTIGCADT